VRQEERKISLSATIKKMIQRRRGGLQLKKAIKHQNRRDSRTLATADGRMLRQTGLMGPSDFEPVGASPSGRVAQARLGGRPLRGAGVGQRGTARSQAAAAGIRSHQQGESVCCRGS